MNSEYCMGVSVSCCVAYDLVMRTYGVWTILAGLVRVHCGFTPSEKSLYRVTCWTFILALWYFASEQSQFSSMIRGSGTTAPLIVASTWTEHHMCGWLAFEAPMCMVHILLVLPFVSLLHLLLCRPQSRVDDCTLSPLYDASSAQGM